MFKSTAVIKTVFKMKEKKKRKGKRKEKEKGKAKAVDEVGWKSEGVEKVIGESVSTVSSEVRLKDGIEAYEGVGMDSADWRGRVYA